MKKLLFLFLLTFSTAAHADSFTQSFDADEILEITTVGKSGQNNSGALYKACLNIYGSFGSGDFYLLQSTDSGTTKEEIKYYSGGALADYYVSAPSNVCFESGWGSNDSNQVIIYGSTTGTTTPSITVDGRDNR